MPLTPNNREEHWLQGMVDGQTTLEPNKRREYWYKEIVDAIGSGGGGGTGGGATVLTATVSGSTATLPCTAAELFAYMQSGAVVVKFISSNPEDPSEYADFIYFIHSAQHYFNDSYAFTSYGFEIDRATGSDIPSFPVA